MLKRVLLVAAACLFLLWAYRFGYQQGLDGAAPEQAQPAVSATPVFYDDVPGWSDALVFDLSACAGCPAAARWDDTAAAYFEEHFVIEGLATPQGSQGLMTGYYAPVIEARLTAEDGFDVPLYARPDDLTTIRLGAFDPALKGKAIHGRWDGNSFVPYHDRAALDGHGDLIPVAYVADKVTRFFLQIQGSGLIRLGDGRMMRAAYAGKNGRPYYAIGRDLIAREQISPAAMSMQAIRDWLYANPDEAEELMDKNPAFTFFRLLADDLAVTGAANVPLIADQSVAVDPAFHAYGEFLYAYDLASETGYIVRADDTGGAIRGPLRLDLYRGTGAEGEAKAGALAAPIRLYRLVPRQSLGDGAAP